MSENEKQKNNESTLALRIKVLKKWVLPLTLLAACSHSAEAIIPVDVDNDPQVTKPTDVPDTRPPVPSTEQAGNDSEPNNSGSENTSEEVILEISTEKEWIDAVKEATEEATEVVGMISNQSAYSLNKEDITFWSVTPDGKAKEEEKYNLSELSESSVILGVERELAGIEFEGNIVYGITKEGDRIVQLTPVSQGGEGVLYIVDGAEIKESKKDYSADITKAQEIAPDAIKIVSTYAYNATDNVVATFYPEKGEWGENPFSDNELDNVENCTSNPVRICVQSWIAEKLNIHGLSKDGEAKPILDHNGNTTGFESEITITGWSLNGTGQQVAEISLVTINAETGERVIGEVGANTPLPKWNTKHLLAYISEGYYGRLPPEHPYDNPAEDNTKYYANWDNSNVSIPKITKGDSFSLTFPIPGTNSTWEMFNMAQDVLKELTDSLYKDLNVYLKDGKVYQFGTKKDGEIPFLVPTQAEFSKDVTDVP